MKTLTRRTTFFLSAIPSPHFRYSLNLFFHSTNIQDPQRKKEGSSHLYYSSSSWRYHDEESRNVRVLVWWDFGNCSVPFGVNAFRVAQRITSALRDNGIKGPVTITAFGDVLQLSRSNQEALSSTGIYLNHIPHGGKNCADKSLLVDLLCWVSQNPPPAHLFLISGDSDFASILHRLRMNNYNILLASSESAPGALCNAASIMWHWNSLVRGDSCGGKIYNQPPDGPYGSWYGHYKGPLEDPFLGMGQPTSLQAEESSEPGTDPKVRPIPKPLVNRIRQILYSHPKGINITEVRSELGRSNVAMDKDFFGHKNFSRLLLSLPKVLTLQFASDGQILVQSVLPKAAEPVESNLRLSTGSRSNNREEGPTVVAELNGRNNAVTENLNGKSSPPAVSPPKEEPPSLGPKEIAACPSGGHSTPLEQENSISEVGFFQRIWRNLFSNKSGVSSESSNSISAKCSVSTGNLEKTRSKEQSLESKSHLPEPLGSSSFSSTHIKESEEKTGTNSEENDDKSRMDMGFFNQFVNWCRCWRTRTNPDSASGQHGKEVNEIKNQSGNNELFSKEFFWDAMESFMHTPKGSALVSQSRTREQMAQLLQKEGPSVLNTLSVGDLLHLVDLLISEKKWVDECLSQTFPFKLIDPARSWSSSPTNPQGSNGLSSIFSGTLSHSNLQRSADCKTGNEDQNHTQTGVSLADSNKKPCVKSRSEILVDCQKLVDEILVEHPQGFNISCFRSLFLEKYGYALGYQKLGFYKLSAVLQIMQGVKIEGTYIIPIGKVAPDSQWESALPYSHENNGIGKESNSDRELSDSTRKDNDCGSSWDELGPISETSSNQNETESRLKGKTNEEMVEHMDIDDDSYLSDQVCSDLDGESPIVDGSEGQRKFRRNEDDSSLLQILDSWYSSNNGRLHNVDALVDCSRNGSKSLCSSGVGADSTLPVSNCGRKTKSRKNYSFVSDTEGDEKGKLIDSILGSLKKSAESRVQS